MPERYILRRWTRDCKRTIVPDLKNPFKNVDDNLSGLVFVNSIMRLSYDMAYEAKGDAGSRSRVHRCMWKLRHQLLKDREVETKYRQKTGVDRTGEAKQMRDPSTVKTQAKSVRRKWRNSRLKGNRGGSPVSFKSNEVEKSFNAPDRYWPVFCDEFNSQQSHLLSTASVDLQHQMDNEMVNMEGRFDDHSFIVMAGPNPISQDDVFFRGVWTPYLEKLQEWEDRFHQFNYLISRPDVVYYSHRNSVEASDEAWTEIGRIRPELLVYRPRGEPYWDQLRVLFRDVIVLSESQSVGNAPNAAASHSECVSEVVNQYSSSFREKKAKKKSPSCSRGSSSTRYST
ncbi:hypothetical protein C2S51_010695 [Perilla frutescens var. frutescens]|nr:hypothetical protein C2S51_010695 [Perilla frutescens var. frutescens]